jgi:hypothetical protein
MKYISYYDICQYRNIAWIIHEMKKMKNKKSPLPVRERVGERVIVKRYPLPSIPYRKGRGIIFCIIC